MGSCKCKGIKLAVFGALLVINDQGWIWTAVSAWTLVGVLLLLWGIEKIVWPCCPVHCKPGSSAAPAVKKKGR